MVGSETTFAQRAGTAAPSRSKIPPTARRGAHAHTQAPIFLSFSLCYRPPPVCLVLFKFFFFFFPALFNHLLLFLPFARKRKNWKGDDRDTQRQNLIQIFLFLFWLSSCLGHFEQKCVRSSWFIRRPCVVHPTQRLGEPRDLTRSGSFFFLDFFETRPKILKLLFILANCWNPKVFLFWIETTWLDSLGLEGAQTLCVNFSLWFFVCRNKMETLKRKDWFVCCSRE